MRWMHVTGVSVDWGSSSSLLCLYGIHRKIKQSKKHAESTLSQSNRSFADGNFEGSDSRDLYPVM